ncbi:MAG TPA: ATP-binding protein [Pseudonocardiaceae bacterium]|nr:ATP-binding protein [Pseudonocardiaceae bacterium]
MDTEGLLRGVELFEGLTDEQYAWLASVTERCPLADGEELFHDGDLGTHFYVLVAGELVITKMVDGREEMLTRHSTRPQAIDQHDGKPTEAHRFTGELPLLTNGGHIATATAAGPTLVFAYDRDHFFEMLTRLPSMANMLLPVLAWRIKSSEQQARSRATIAALGTLAAGLAHELNNPAAAVARAAELLCPVIDRLDHTAQDWGRDADAAERQALRTTIGEALRAVPVESDPLTTADAEDEITDWALEVGAENADQLAGALAGRGLTVDWLRATTAAIGEQRLPRALDYLATVLEARLLTGEVRTAGERISSIVATTKEYTNLDRAPRQPVAVNDCLEATLTVLGPKLDGVKVVRAYSPSVPRIMAYQSELNQVWTNLIDNAVDAMNGKGTLGLRTCVENHSVVVEISDTGIGIPEEIQSRIFEPFYTTKDVGKGTGLGLHLSYRIVTQRHHGSITVRSLPGDTRVIVRIPVEEKP